MLIGIQIKYGITRIIVSTYQSITGTGRIAVNQLNNEYKILRVKAYDVLMILKTMATLKKKNQ